MPIVYVCIALIVLVLATVIALANEYPWASLAVAVAVTLGAVSLRRSRKRAEEARLLAEAEAKRLVEEQAHEWSKQREKERRRRETEERRAAAEAMRAASEQRRLREAEREVQRIKERQRREEERRRREEEKRQRIESMLRPDAGRDEINYMNGAEFERFMADLLRQKGYAVRATPPTGDQGVDLLVDVDDRRVAIQLKRWTGPVGNAAVQATFAGMAHYEANEGWVITTSTFTKSARQLARSTRVRLIDGKELADWLEGLREA